MQKVEPALIRQRKTLILIGLFDIHVKDATNANPTM